MAACVSACVCELWIVNPCEILSRSIRDPVETGAQARPAICLLFSMPSSPLRGLAMCHGELEPLVTTR